MSVGTVQFIIKALVAGLVIITVYFVISPYQNCVRAGNDAIEESIRTGRMLSGADDPGAVGGNTVEKRQLRFRGACQQSTSW